MRIMWAVMSLALVSAVACDPCAGTPSCRAEPEVSYTGQFVERQSGKSVSGVQIAFVRRGGSLLVADTITAISDRDGFFVLRMSALQDGFVEGDLIITPPAPHTPYTVRGKRLSTHRTRGDGGFLGRLVVNPYLQFIGELHDRKTLAIVPEATVTIRQFGPAVVEPATSQTTSADNGRFSWDPKVIEFGDLDVEFEVSASGYPRSYKLRDTISLQYVYGPPSVAVLAVGGGWAYVGEVMRRGLRQFLPGVTVEFTRTGGIGAQPDRFTATPDENGRFLIPMEPIGDGTLIGDLTIRPPGGLPTETLRDVAITTFDGFGTRLLTFGYGPATIVRNVLIHRATGLPVKEGTHVRVYRVGGLNTFPAPWGVVPDDGIRIVNSEGVIAYDAATLDSGTVFYDFEVRLNAPYAWDTLRAIPTPARFSDQTVSDTLLVGRAIGAIRRAP
jgi:hypothetical protein